MTIRPATPSDIPAILKVEHACATAAHWSEAEYVRLFQAGAVPRTVLVAEEGTIVGFIVLRTVGPEWELENVGVTPKIAHHGIGSQLISAAATQAKERHAEAITLEVRASNVAARGLYRKAGFVEEGLRPGYYANPDEDAVLYRLSLRSDDKSAP